MRLPRGRAILENTNIDFINFDNILHAGKRERSHRIHGYISIIYPQEVDVIFLSLGEPMSAIRFVQGEKQPIPIGDAVKKVKAADVGIINVYEIPEELVLIINSTLQTKPIFKNKSAQEANPEKMLEQLNSEKLTGFLEIKKGTELFYSIIENGAPTRGYFADKLNIQVSNSMLLTVLKAKAKDGSPVVFSLFDEMPQKIEQATPAIINLVLKSANSIIREFASRYGPTFAKKGLKLAKSHVDDEFDFMKDFTVDGVEITGDTLAPKDDFIKAFADFINRFMRTYDTICNDKSKEEMFHSALKDFRFALKTAGFYNYTIFKDE